MEGENKKADIRGKAFVTENISVGGSTLYADPRNVSCSSQRNEVHPIPWRFIIRFDMT